jgi:ribosomal protein L11 methyltransferase
MAWQQLELLTQAEFADDVADWLSEHGALAVTFTDGADQALFQLMPEHQPLWECTQVLALFELDSDVLQLIKNLETHAPQWVKSYRILELAEQDWVRETQRQFPPQCFAERLWILPSWCDADHYTHPKLRLDPGLAFGTGTHPTTALCLSWLAKHPPKGQTVIDYGCGSGILALAALALGATHAQAIDHDPQALEATYNNAALNDFPADSLKPTLDPSMLTPADLVIANILSQPLIELAQAIASLVSKDGELILSGLLSSEIELVAQAYSPWMQVASATVNDDWAMLRLIRLRKIKTSLK